MSQKCQPITLVGQTAEDSGFKIDVNTALFKNTDYEVYRLSYTQYT